MPFDTPPGQVLSSVPPSSGRRRSSKIGGCAGVLFQIFHGKRLFPRKSLPAERPKNGSINHTDDKLPIAKLLLIADENRSGPLNDTDEELEEDNVPKDEPCGEKPSKRVPGVVARLMGLETLPSPEPASGERKQSEPQRKDMDCQFLSDVPQERLTSAEISRKTSVTLQPYGTRTKESKTSLPEKFATRQKASALWKDKAKGDAAKLKVLAKSPSLPPHHLDSSFPSVVSSTKKGDPTNRSSMRTQRATHLLESAAKMLETSAQQNSQMRNERLLSSVSRSKVAPLNTVRNGKVQSRGEQVFVDPRSQAVRQLTTTAAQARRDEVKTRVGAKNTIEMVNRRQSVPSIASNPESRKPQVGGPLQLLGGGKGSLQEAVPGKRKHGYQQTYLRPRCNLLEGAKSDWRQQEETSRRLSQPTSIKVQRLKPYGATHIRNPSPPKSVQDSSGGPCSSQASNRTSSSSEGFLSFKPTISHVGSNNIPTSRLSTSSVEGISSETEGGSDCVDIPNPADLTQGNLCLLQAPSIPGTSRFGETDNNSYSQRSHDDSTSSAIYTESHRRSSMESSLSSDPSLSEFTTSSEDCSNFLVGAVDTIGLGKVEAKWKSDHSNLNEPKRALDMFSPEDSSQSNCELSSVDLGDTASSHTQSDADATRHVAAHTYSGKNTAAILQELLTALSSSTSQRQFDEKSKKSTVDCLESCSSDLDISVEKPQILPGGYSLYAQGLSCMESPFQDSASCNSLDSFEISEGNTQCETSNFLESMDCTNIAETQMEDESSANTTDTKQTSQMEHRLSAKHTDFVDCEALMSTISKLHHIDPEVIGLNVRTTKHDNKEKFQVDVSPRDGFAGCLIGSVLFDKLEEQAQQRDWGLSDSTALTAEDDADSLYRSDMESFFRSGYEDVAAQNKKLATDCINEAFKNLSGQLYGFSLSLSGQSSATHVLSRVYKQIDEWRGMAITMNLDDMVEKEMNSTTRKWRNTGAEVEEVAEVVESTILSGLMEEVLLEMI